MGQRLVDANALKETIIDVLTDIKHIIGIYDTLFDSVINTVCKVIDDAHAIDIVRCGDCKYSKEIDGTHWRLCEQLGGSLFDEAFYCSAGKRKVGDSHE